MRRLTLAIAFLFGACLAAWGQSPAVRTVILTRTIPSYVKVIEGTYPAVACNLKIPQCWSPSNGVTSIAKFGTFTRATSRLALWSDGHWSSFASGVMAITDMGYWSDLAATNLALWSRDMTQSGTWVATTMTVALNATGIDGTANSASTLTATGANAKLIQSLTLASAARTASVFIKCVTCTGNIQYSNSAVLSVSYTTLSSANCFNPLTQTGTAPNTSSFVRCEIDNITALNPVIGFNIVNSGDSIVVDNNQLVAGAFALQPVFTTTGTAAANGDVFQLNTALNAIVGSSAGTLLITTNDGVTRGADSNLFGGSASRTWLSNTFLDSFRSFDSSYSNAFAWTTGTCCYANRQKTALAFTSISRTGVSNNGTQVTNANPLGTVAATYLGTYDAGAEAYAAIEFFAIYPIAFSAADLAAQTAP